jgi:hypothetical protein
MKAADRGAETKRATPCRGGICLKRGHGSCDVRNVLGFAHEVRIVLRDARVIFASIVCVEEPERDSFVIQPWGVRGRMTLSFEDIAHATPVTHMNWERQRSITALQMRELS